MNQPQIRGYSVQQQAKFLHESPLIDDARRADAIRSLSATMRDDLDSLDPAAWYPREHSIELLRAIASTTDGEEETRALLAQCGEFIAGEATTTFLKILMRLMTPVLFAKKLPSLWDRDMRGGAFDADVSRAKQRHIAFNLRDIEGYDHIAPVTIGWLRFAMKALGEPSTKVRLSGWSLDTPGPRDVSYEVEW